MIQGNSLSYLIHGLYLERARRPPFPQHFMSGSYTSQTLHQKNHQQPLSTGGNNSAITAKVGQEPRLYTSTQSSAPLAKSLPPYSSTTTIFQLEVRTQRVTRMPKPKFSINVPRSVRTQVMGELTPYDSMHLQLCLIKRR